MKSTDSREYSMAREAQMYDAYDAENRYWQGSMTGDNIQPIMSHDMRKQTKCSQQVNPAAVIEIVRSLQVNTDVTGDDK